MAFKDRLKESRIKKGYTQEQLAHQIGIAKSTFTGYEKGNREPDMLKISQILSLLDVDANYLWQDEMNYQDTKKSSAEAEDGRLIKIIETYNDMNEAGQDSLYDQAIMHSKNEKFKKYNSVTETA